MGRWVLAAQKIPPSEHEKMRQKAKAFAEKRPWSTAFEIGLRFRGKFCYIDAIEKKTQYASPLCRLEYYGENEWGLGFYTYSNERYEPCYFPSGKNKGTLEEAIVVCEGYLTT